MRQFATGNLLATKWQMITVIWGMKELELVAAGRLWFFWINVKTNVGVVGINWVNMNESGGWDNDLVRFLKNWDWKNGIRICLFLYAFLKGWRQLLHVLTCTTAHYWLTYTWWDYLFCLDFHGVVLMTRIQSEERVAADRLGFYSFIWVTWGDMNRVNG